MLRTAKLLLALVPMLGLLPGATTFGASIQEVKNSTWDTRYKAANGATIRSKLRFNGSTGSYSVTNSSGQRIDTGSLSNIRYFNGGNDKVLITGNWQLRNFDGAFQFNVSEDGLAINGAWNDVDNGTGGNWSGSLSSNNGGGNGGGGNVGGGGNGGGGNNNGSVRYSGWKYNPQKNYYYCKCSFPAGGYQYVIYKKSKPYWVYWYNPQKQVFWCACPTVDNPTWGDEIEDGEDLFLMANVKASSIDDCEFPKVGNNKSKFKKGKATDIDGSTVDLGCPPSDLP